MKKSQSYIYFLTGLIVFYFSAQSSAEETNNIYKWQIGKYAKHQNKFQDTTKEGISIKKTPEDKAQLYKWQMEQFPKNSSVFNINFTAEEPVTKLVHSDDELFQWQMKAFVKNHPDDPTADTSFKEDQAADSTKTTK